MGHPREWEAGSIPAPGSTCRGSMRRGACRPSCSSHVVADPLAVARVRCFALRGEAEAFVERDAAGIRRLDVHLCAERPFARDRAEIVVEPTCVAHAARISPAD